VHGQPQHPSFPGAWEDDPDPDSKKRICTITITIAGKFPRHTKNPAWCKNGKNCAYNHTTTTKVRSKWGCSTGTGTGTGTGFPGPGSE
jgi:hypothetical protein